MRSTRYFVAISLCLIVGAIDAWSCGPFEIEDANELPIFRVCESKGGEEYALGVMEMEENCRLWRDITSPSIPLSDINSIVYKTPLEVLKNLNDSTLIGNQFAAWLKTHDDDYTYLLKAKEIEDLRSCFNDPWYYPYDNDPEHQRLSQLQKECENYRGSRHQGRYVLQLMRIYLSTKNYPECLRLWDTVGKSLPNDVVRRMIGSYAAGAMLRGRRVIEAVKLYEECEDVRSLIAIGHWRSKMSTPQFTDSEVQRLEYAFDRFPDSPYIRVLLQKVVVDCERATLPDFFDETVRHRKSELKTFSLNCAKSGRACDRAMYYYTAAYIDFINKDYASADKYLRLAEKAPEMDLLKEPILGLRIVLDAYMSSPTTAYINRLYSQLKAIDSMLAREVKELPGEDGVLGWLYRNKFNYTVCFWQDVVRRALLGPLRYKLLAANRHVLALQLANYACNRFAQLLPYTVEYDYTDDTTPFKKMDINTLRNQYNGFNYYDYSNEFFLMADKMCGKELADYANSLSHTDAFGRFLNERGYVDTDYIFDIVGTHYLRDFDYENATKWLERVSASYQSRTNIAKDGYFKRDPFAMQDVPRLINDNSDYKLNFAREMARLDYVSRKSTDPNRRAQARIRLAIGLINQFGRCWYLCYYSDGDARVQGEDSSEFYDHAAGSRKYNTTCALLLAQDEIDIAFKEFTDKEIAAKAQLQFGNYRTVIKRYGHTKVAAEVRRRCDRYVDYHTERLRAHPIKNVKARGCGFLR